MKPKIVAIIQARAESSRLPKKVLLDIEGEPMLVHVFQRTQLAKTVNQVVVATTNHPADDTVAQLCEAHGFPCYRGSSGDVLDRYYQAAKQYGAEIIVRITADCPVIDPEVIDSTVLAFLGIQNASPDEVIPITLESFDAIPYDFAANRLPPPWGRTFPIGLDTEVCTFQNLEIIWKEAKEKYQREHVMPFFYDNPDRFRVLHVTHDPDYGKLRWTVDTAEDLELIRKIYQHFKGRFNFSWLEILEYYQQHPELAQINAAVQHKAYKEVDTRPEVQD